MHNRLAGHQFSRNANLLSPPGLVNTSTNNKIRLTPFSFKKCLPVLGRAQGGEEGNLVMEDQPIDWTFRPANLQGVQAAFAVYVTGDSMLPKYKDQDLAYIHPSQTPQIGRFVLVETWEHTGFIKQFDGWKGDTLRLKQFNPAKELRFKRSEIKSLMLVIGSMDAS